VKLFSRRNSTSCFYIQSLRQATEETCRSYWSWVMDLTNIWKLSVVYHGCFFYITTCHVCGAGYLFFCK